MARTQSNPSVSHLLSFIRLVDYLVVNTLHTLVVNAVTKLLAELQEQVRQTPSYAVIRSWSQHSEAVNDPADQEMDTKVRRWFRVFTSAISAKPYQLQQGSILYGFGYCVCVFTSQSQNIRMSNLCSSLSWCWTQMLWPSDPLRKTSRSVPQFVMDSNTFKWFLFHRTPTHCAS